MKKPKKNPAPIITSKPIKKSLPKVQPVVKPEPEPIQIAKSIVESPPEPIKPNPPTDKPRSVSFYSRDIRCIFVHNQWYFSLEDIIKLADAIDPTKFLIELKNQPELKDKYFKIVESYSYTENSNPMVISVVNYQGFMEVLPSIRNLGYLLPGPFPQWLQNMANQQF